MQEIKARLQIPRCLVINDVLIIPIVVSWLLYPWAISWLYPNSVRLIFGASLVVASLLVIWLGARQKWRPDRSEQVLAVLMGGYLVSTFLASLVFNDGDAGLLLRYMLKFVFFLLLVTYLTRTTIYLVADIYVYICMALVLFSMAGIVAIAMGWEELSFIDVVRGVDDVGVMIRSFSGYDGTARIFPDTDQFVRMQSFAMEPGAFALALLPALYWATLVREQYAHAALIALGVSASWSVGALLALVLAVTLLLKNSLVPLKSKTFLAIAIAFFLFSHSIFSWGIIQATSMVVTAGDKTLGDKTLGDKTLSMQQRVDELLEVVNFVRHDYWGAGVAAGRRVLDSSISVGYANVFADVGILGGFLYSLICLLLTYMAGRCVLGWHVGTRANALAVSAMGLSVLTCLFFGLQREQPDASFWHMWIYACFIVLYRLNCPFQRQSR